MRIVNKVEFFQSSIFIEILEDILKVFKIRDQVLNLFY